MLMGTGLRNNNTKQHGDKSMKLNYMVVIRENGKRIERRLQMDSKGKFFVRHNKENVYLEDYMKTDGDYSAYFYKVERKANN